MNTSIVTMKNRGTSPNAIRSVNTFFAINTSNSNHKEKKSSKLIIETKKGGDEKGNYENDSEDGEDYNIHKETRTQKATRNLGYLNRKGKYLYDSGRWYSVKIMEYLKTEQLHTVHYSTGETQKLDIDLCLREKSFYFTDNNQDSQDKKKSPNSTAITAVTSTTIPHCTEDEEEGKNHHVAPSEKVVIRPEKVEHDNEETEIYGFKGRNKLPKRVKHETGTWRTDSRKGRKKLPKRVKHETGTWSTDSRQLCLDTFMEYCDLSSRERYKKIDEILGGERKMKQISDHIGKIRRREKKLGNLDHPYVKFGPKESPRVPKKKTIIFLKKKTSIVLKKTNGDNNNNSNIIGNVSRYKKSKPTAFPPVPPSFIKPHQLFVKQTWESNQRYNPTGCCDAEQRKEKLKNTVLKLANKQGKKTWKRMKYHGNINPLPGSYWWQNTVKLSRYDGPYHPRGMKNLKNWSMVSKKPSPGRCCDLSKYFTHNEIVDMWKTLSQEEINNFDPGETNYAADNNNNLQDAFLMASLFDSTATSTPTDNSAGSKRKRVDESKEVSIDERNDDHNNSGNDDRRRPYKRNEFDALFSRLGEKYLPYKKQLINEGYDDIPELRNCDLEELTSVFKMKEGHAKRLLFELKNICV